MRFRKLWRAGWLSAGVLLATPTLANDGHMGVDLSLSEQSAKVGLYTLREAPQDITNLGVNALFNTDSDYMIDLFGSIAKKGLFGSPNVELGLKGKLFYLEKNADTKNGYGLMMGVLGRYWLPTSMPSAIYADYLYAPEVTVFGDARTANEWKVRGELQMLSNVMAYLGYRKLEADFASGSHNLDDHFMIGVRIGF